MSSNLSDLCAVFSSRTSTLVNSAVTKDRRLHSDSDMRMLKKSAQPTHPLGGCHALDGNGVGGCTQVGFVMRLRTEYFVVGTDQGVTKFTMHSIGFPAKGSPVLRPFKIR